MRGMRGRGGETKMGEEGGETRAETTSASGMEAFLVFGQSLGSSVFIAVQVCTAEVLTLCFTILL